MKRSDKFLALKNHPWLKKSYNRLSKENIEFAVQFLDSNENDDKNTIASKMVRLFLFDPNKPKYWKEIEELLIASL